MIARVVRGPLLNPTLAGGVDYFRDGAIAADDLGRITFVGDWAELDAALGSERPPITRSRGVICPPFLDAHIHIPQHPIRGRFAVGIGDHPTEGRLLAALNRNVFPAEAKFANAQYARHVVGEFERDTLAHGVVGGAAYATVHANSADIALKRLHRFWSIGLVLMNQNCPEYLRNDEFVMANLAAMARRHGQRFIITDRFAVAVSSALRRSAVGIASDFGLRTQTHLNEQRSEKHLVEETLYPNAGSYTNVYLQDGLLNHRAILAHCIHMSDAELVTVASKSCSIAHCPTSNTLLGSGVMPLDRVVERGIDWAICTDVGASPTTSILCEMAQFLKVHAGRSSHATPSVALYRATLAPAKMLGLDREIGRFAEGMPLTFLQIDGSGGALATARTADEVIANVLLGGQVTPSSPAAITTLAECGLHAGEALSELEHDVHRTAKLLDAKVLSVTLGSREVWKRD